MNDIQNEGTRKYKEVEITKLRIASNWEEDITSTHYIYWDIEYKIKKMSFSFETGKDELMTFTKTKRFNALYEAKKYIDENAEMLLQIK